MKICFCATFLENEEQAIINSKIKPAVSTHKFNLNILEGIRKNVGDNLTVLNTENVASYPNYNKIIIRAAQRNKNEIGEYLNIGKINLPIFKNVTETILLYKQLKKWLESNVLEDIYICGYGRRFSHVIAINVLKKKHKQVKTCMVLADLSGKVACKTQKSTRIIQKIHDKLLEFQVNQSKKFDSFVLLTEAMAYYLNIEDKHYTIVEGICSKELITFNSDDKKDSKEKIIAYAGILSKQYNVDILIDAFLNIKDDSYKLWLFGDGELKEYIQKLSIKNNNIIFFGYVPNEQLRQKLSKAMVLVNPRQNLEEYTKYSFPSKIIEYLTLEKPVIGYRLDGTPTEYEDYIFYVEDNTIERLKDRIIEICGYSKQKLLEIGKKNSEFIINNKNNIVQTQKILNMFKDMKDKNDI